MCCVRDFQGKHGFYACHGRAPTETSNLSFGPHLLMSVPQHMMAALSTHPTDWQTLRRWSCPLTVTLHQYSPEAFCHWRHLDQHHIPCHLALGEKFGNCEDQRKLQGCGQGQGLPRHPLPCSDTGLSHRWKSRGCESHEQTHTDIKYIELTWTDLRTHRYESQGKWLIDKPSVVRFTQMSALQGQAVQMEAK